MATAPQTHIIYISGLGDRSDNLRRFLLRFWRIYGVETELVAVKWSDNETFDAKLGRVRNAITTAKAKGYRVVLLGESAGGSMALNAYAQAPELVSRVVTLCGKNSKPEAVAPAYYRNNPSFRGSMQLLNKSVQSLSLDERRRMTSIYPLYDPTVPIVETFIPDCRRVRIWSVGHVASILFGLTVAAFLVVREARRA